MKKLLLLLFLFSPALAYAQPDTEVFLFDISMENGTYIISNPVNISNNPGYDSQPSFTPDGQGILFSSTRNGQTDAVLYSISAKSKTWLSDSPGGEYSPTVIPGGTHFSTIILKSSGEQLLWKYPMNGSNTPEVVVPEIVIGYHTWFDSNTLFSFVLGDSTKPATLQKHDLSNKTNTVITNNPGRSLHKIPGTQTISFVDKSDPDTWTVKAYDPLNKSFTVITQTLKGSEDMAWSPGGVIFMGSGSKLFTFQPGEGKDWKLFADLNELGLTGISRIAISPNSDKIVVVVNK